MQQMKLPHHAGTYMPKRRKKPKSRESVTIIPSCTFLPKPPQGEWKIPCQPNLHTLR